MISLIRFKNIQTWVCIQRRNGINFAKYKRSTCLNVGRPAVTDMPTQRQK